jgi:hypothetical protein
LYRFEFLPLYIVSVKGKVKVGNNFFKGTQNPPQSARGAHS